jgi:hypothetical protein
MHNLKLKNMAKTTENNDWEKEKQIMKKELYTYVIDFLKDDKEVNKCFLNIMRTVEQRFKENPDMFGDDTNLKDLLKELRNTKEGGNNPSEVKGSDIEGAGWLQNLIDFIKECGDFINGEKKFFMELIRLIFCGCDDKG